MRIMLLSKCAVCESKTLQFFEEQEAIGLVSSLGTKGINIAKNPQYDGYQMVLVSMIYKFFDKVTSSANTFAMFSRSETLITQNWSTDVAVKTEIVLNEGSAEELHKTIIREIGKWKVQSQTKQNRGR